MMNRPMMGKTLFAVCVGLFLVLHMPIPTDAHSSNDAGTTLEEKKAQGRFSSFLGGITSSFKAKETADVGERSLLRQFPDVQRSPDVNPGDNRMTINGDSEIYHDQGDHSVSDMVSSLFRGIKDGLAGKDVGMQALSKDYDIGNLMKDNAGVVVCFFWGDFHYVTHTMYPSNVMHLFLVELQESIHYLNGKESRNAAKMKEAAKSELPLEESAEVQQPWFRSPTEEDDGSKNDFAQRMEEVALLKELFERSYHQQRKVVEGEVQHLLRSEVRSLCCTFNVSFL